MADCTYTEFTLRRDLEEWLHQNDGEIVDGIDGVLIDNLYVLCRRGQAYLFEIYANYHSSLYHVYFFPYKNPDEDKLREIEERWNDLYDIIYRRENDE